MSYIYRKAGIEDIELLLSTRIKVLRAANELNNEVDMSLVEHQSREYYVHALEADEHAAYLIFDEDVFIGAGGVSFFRVMPTYHNPTGYRAYIMNMYTIPSYRRKGIAFRTLELLTEEARRKGITQVSLEATPMGRKLYEKYGFLKMEDEMKLSLTER